MNANRNLVIDFRINGKHDHYIGDEKRTQPSFIVNGDKNGRVTCKGTKKKRRYN